MYKKNDKFRFIISKAIIYLASNESNEAPYWKNICLLYITNNYYYIRPINNKKEDNKKRRTNRAWKQSHELI